MFNCGMLAIELPKEDIDTLFALGDEAVFRVDLDQSQVIVESSQGVKKNIPFELNSFDRELVQAGGWLSYADSKY